MIRAPTRLSPEPAALRAHEPAFGDSAETPAEVLRQALSGFLPPSAALFHLFDRMETQR